MQPENPVSNPQHLDLIMTMSSVGTTMSEALGSSSGNQALKSDETLRESLAGAQVILALLSHKIFAIVSSKVCASLTAILNAVIARSAGPAQPIEPNARGRQTSRRQAGAFKGVAAEPSCS